MLNRGGCNVVDYRSIDGMMTLVVCVEKTDFQIDVGADKENQSWSVGALCDQSLNFPPKMTIMKKEPIQKFRLN